MASWAGEQDMKAAQLSAAGRFEVRETNVPDLNEGDVLVRMIGTSICGSDLHVVFGNFLPDDLPATPGYPGHEGVGRVELSRSSRHRPGDLVLAVPHSAQATCFADYHVTNGSSLVTLPVDADPWRLLMAQQLGTVVYAMKKFVGDRPGSGTAVVIGAGSAGLFFAQLLRARGYDQIIVSEPVRSRRQSASEVGADVVIDPEAAGVSEVVLDATSGAGAGLVVDAAGTIDARQDAVDCAADDATVGLFGFPDAAGLEPFPLAASWRKMLRLITSANTQHEPGLRSFREAVDMLMRDQIDVSSLLSGQRRSLAEINDAFEDAKASPVEKVVIELCGPRSE